MVVLFFFAVRLENDPDCSNSPGGTEECPARRPARTVAAPTAAVYPDGGWEEVTVGEIRGVILPMRAAGSLVHGARPEIPEEDYWTPVLADVELAEAAIAGDQGALEHMRQYAGFIENGERKILVNGFCDAFGVDWMSEPVRVDDGGDCFFTAIYNVDRDDLEMFRFNGLA